MRQSTPEEYYRDKTELAHRLRVAIAAIEDVREINRFVGRRVEADRIYETSIETLTDQLRIAEFTGD